MGTVWPSERLVVESGCMSCMCHQSEDSIRVRFPGSRYHQIKLSMIRYHYFPLKIYITRDRVALAAKLKSIHCPYLQYFIITKGPSLIEPLIQEIEQIEIKLAIVNSSNIIIEHFSFSSRTEVIKKCCINMNPVHCKLMAYLFTMNEVIPES